MKGVVCFLGLDALLHRWKGGEGVVGGKVIGWGLGVLKGWFCCCFGFDAVRGEFHAYCR